MASDQLPKPATPTKAILTTHPPAGIDRRIYAIWWVSIRYGGTVR